MSLAVDTTALREAPPYIDRPVGARATPSFERRLSKATFEAAGAGGYLSLISAGIDNFATMAWRDGPTAERCEERICKALERELRWSGAFLTRLGLGQFGIIVPDADRATVWTLAERLVGGVERLQLAHPAARGSRLSLSAGVATSHGRWDMDGMALWVVAEHAQQCAVARGGRCAATSAQ